MTARHLVPTSLTGQGCPASTAVAVVAAEFPVGRVSVLLPRHGSSQTEILEGNSSRPHSLVHGECKW